MQSTAAAPASQPLLYRSMLREVRECERLGFDSVWFAEHRFWYDGWTPTSLLAAAAAAGATQRIHVGTAMLILPQHEVGRVIRSADTMDRQVGQRLDLGVALGYRDEEYDGLGLLRARRGKLMEHALGELKARGWLGSGGRGGVWMGGIAQPVLERGVRNGLNFLLPSTLTTEEVRAVTATIRESAERLNVQAGRIGVIKDTWVDEDSREAKRFFLPRLAGASREYGAWWVFKGAYTGFERPDLLDKQVERAAATAFVGGPADVAESMNRLYESGVDEIVMHLHRDTTRAQFIPALKLIAEQVVPRIRARPAPSSGG